MAAGHLPGQGAAPVVADQHRLVGAQSIDQRHHVGHQPALPVGVHLGGAAGFTVAAQVRGHRVVPGLRQRRQLITPGGPAFRETVQAKHQRRPGFAGLGDEEVHSIGGQAPFADKCHVVFSLCGWWLNVWFPSGQSGNVTLGYCP